MTAAPKMREDGTVVNTAHPAHFSTTVIENRSLSERYYLLVLSRPQGFEDPGPGTFVHLLVPDGGRFYLRRPFSVLDCDGDTILLRVDQTGVACHTGRRSCFYRGLAEDGQLQELLPVETDPKELYGD